MSRTNHSRKSKAPGYEYWSRNTPREAMSPGRWSKKRKIRLIRREGKKVGSEV